MGTTSRARASITAVSAVLGAVVLVTVLVTWAASIGTSDVLTGSGPETVRTTTAEEESPEPLGIDQVREERDRDEQRPVGDQPWVDVLALVVMSLAGLVVCFVLWRVARATWRELDARRRPPAEDVALDFDVLHDPDLLARAIEEDAAAQRRLLLGGSPRNGIVECWHRFEVQAAEVGFARHHWETSSEFTLRMLDLVGADSHQVALLASLYREARFSDHELDERARSAALAALDAVHTGLVHERSRR